MTLADLIGSAEWQTVVLYFGLFVLVGIALWRWNTSDEYKNFKLIHAITNREGFYDADRAHLTGSFLIAAFATVVAVIRDHVDAQVVILVGGLVSAFALKSGWSYTVSRHTEADIKRTEINRAARLDVELHDEREIAEEDVPPKKSRSDSLFR